MIRGMADFAAMCSSALLACGIAAAQPGMDAEPDPARPMLVSQTDGLVAGATNTLAVSFDLDEGWHVYWPGQNSTGFAPTIELTLPEGWSAGAVRWPAPHRHVLPGEILDYIYEDGEATFLIPVTIPEDAATGPVRLSADLEWLVCREACIPGWGTVMLETTVLPPTARPRPSAAAARIETARKRLPVVLRKTKDGPLPAIETSRRGERFEIRVRPERIEGGVEWIAFYPAEDGAPVADPIRSALSMRDETGAAGPLVLRVDGSGPVRGIVEVKRVGERASLLYRIDTRPANETLTPAGGG